MIAYKHFFGEDTLDPEQLMSIDVCIGTNNDGIN